MGHTLIMDNNLGDSLMKEKIYQNFEIWFAVGSQHLYGEETLRQVEDHAKEIVASLNGSSGISATIVYKALLTRQEEITKFCQDASNTSQCGGVIFWMHTFSPSKMWINGLKILTKPILHLHTQFNKDIPWNTIDMDFMNLNQSAHGGREHGFVNSCMKIERKVVVGHWKEPEVITKIDTWIRAVAGFSAMQTAQIVRFGDNMRNVAVTDGNKVSAQITFGYNVHAHGVGDLVDIVNGVSENDIDILVAEYENSYILVEDLQKGGSRHGSLREAARLELGIEKFLVDGNFSAFTTNFEDLHGICQLPGLACQRLMAKGYGFGGEGDWKTAALVYLCKVMGKGLQGGSSFMEDYTYHLNSEQPLVLGSHMLEVCPSIAGGNPVRLEVHPLGIGGKDDPIRMVFNGEPGKGLNATMLDMGNRYRLLINEVEAVAIDHDMPKLPVARVLWDAKPSLYIAAEGWILSGGAHHTAYTQSVTTEMLQDYALMCGVEVVVIDQNTTIESLRDRQRWNDLYYTMQAFSRK